MSVKMAYCKVNICPVRADHKDTAEIVTQLLFGELLEVHEIVDSWCKITVFADNYPGWIDVKQIGFLSPKEANRWMDSMVLEKAMIREIDTPWGKQWISRGAYVSSTLSEKFNIGNDHFEFSDDVPTTVNNQPAELALTYLNTPYLWGGKSPFGIDCSGFTQMVFRFFDINLPRDASQQVEHGEEVYYEEAMVNDLAFFKNEAGKVIHVGILLEDKKIIHASGQVRIDRLTTSGILNEDKKEITHTLYGIRRL